MADDDAGKGVGVAERAEHMEGRKESVPRPLLGFCGLGVIPVVLYAMGGEVSVYRLISMGLFGIGASLSLGAFVGALFGVPKRLQDVGRASEAAYASNSNLEQISDWLTKILVGVSLTQVPALSGVIQSAGSHLANGAGAPNASAFFSVLTLYYVFTGFFIGYLWTSFTLRARLEATERGLVEDVAAKFAQDPHFEEAVEKATKQLVATDLGEKIEDVVSEKDRRDLLARSTVNRQLEPPKGGTRPTPAEFREAVLGGSDRARYEIFETARTHRREVYQLRDPSKRKEASEPIIPIFEALIEADIQGKFHRNYGQLGFTLKLAERWEEAERHLSRAIEIRDENGELGYPLYELNRAECRIKMGRQFETLVGAAEGAREAILADIKAAIARSPDIHRRLLEAGPVNRTVLDWLTAQKIDVQSLA